MLYLKAWLKLAKPWSSFVRRSYLSNLKLYFYCSFATRIFQYIIHLVEAEAIDWVMELKDNDLLGYGGMDLLLAPLDHFTFLSLPVIPVYLLYLIKFPI